MATVRCWLDLPYGLYEDAVRVCAMSHGLFSDVELTGAFCIVPSMHVPISGGIPPC